MNILITGGAGFIGSHVAEAFYNDGFNVFILDHQLEEKKDNLSIPYTALPYSILDPICEQIFNRYQFHAVVHLAAQVSVAKSVISPLNDAQINIIGLLQILQYAHQFNVKKFVFASSAAVYGNNPALPLSEQELPAPIAPYGVSKLTGEHYCTLANSSFLQTVSLRFSNVFGPRQTVEGEGGVISIFINSALRNESIVIHGDGTQTRDFIYVKDVANAILIATKRNMNGIFNVSTQTETSVQKIASIIEQLHGTIDVKHSTRREGDIELSILHNGCLQRFNWTADTSIEQGLKETYDWAKEAIFTTKLSRG